MIHLFFVSTKQTIAVQGTDYQAWHLGSRYYVLPSDPRPKGQTVHNIIALLASAGTKDMLYIVEPNDSSVIDEATQLPEFAGGGKSYGSAWADLLVKSYNSVGIHSTFANPGVVAEYVMNIRWNTEVQDGDGNDIYDTAKLKDWIDAGKPVVEAFTLVPHRVLGAD